MEEIFINLTEENIEGEHICCAISDKKHQAGVTAKKEWLKERIKEGHVFRKLDAKGKVFIEYAPLEKAWVPIDGEGYMYIYCLWVAGSFKGKGYGKELLEYAIQDAKEKKKSGICIISSKKKKPYLSDKKFLEKFGFQVVDTVGQDYELLALSFDGTKPYFRDNVKKQEIPQKELTIYYTIQCPFVLDCIKQVEDYGKNHNIPISINKIDSLEKAKNIPCIFSNWATFKDGIYLSNTLLNANMIDKLYN